MFCDRQQLIPFPNSMGHKHGYNYAFEKGFLGGKEELSPSLSIAL